MSSLNKILALMLVTFFAISIILMPQCVRADSSLTLSNIGSTESTLTFSWTQSENPNFTSYTLYQSDFDLQTYGNVGDELYTGVWSTTDVATTTVTIEASSLPVYHLVGNSIWYFYIVENDSDGNSVKSNIISASPTTALQTLPSMLLQEQRVRLPYRGLNTTSIALKCLSTAIPSR